MKLIITAPFYLLALTSLCIPQILWGMDVQVKQPEVETTQQEAVEAKPEVFVTLVTSEGTPDEKSFLVPLSFIKASKTLNAEYERAISPLGNDAESTETDGDDTQAVQPFTLTSSMISSDVFSLIYPYCALIGKLHALRKATP